MLWLCFVLIHISHILLFVSLLEKKWCYKTIETERILNCAEKIYPSYLKKKKTGEKKWNMNENKKINLMDHNKND